MLDSSLSGGSAVPAEDANWKDCLVGSKSAPSVACDADLKNDPS